MWRKGEEEQKKRVKGGKLKEKKKTGREKTKRRSVGRVDSKGVRERERWVGGKE